MMGAVLLYYDTASRADARTRPHGERRFAVATSSPLWLAGAGTVRL